MAATRHDVPDAHPFPESWEASRSPHVDLDAGSGGGGGASFDERLRAAICERLQAEPGIDASILAVAVSSGEVTLSGAVAEVALARRAVEIATGTEGVRRVHDEILVHA